MSFDCYVNNALFSYMYSVVHASFNYRTESTGCRGCHQQTSVPVYNQPCWCQLDRNCDHQISTSIRVKCWWHRVFFRQRTVVDADHRGGWTQIFGGNTSQMETSGPVVIRIFTYPTGQHFAPPLGASQLEFRSINYTESLGYLPCSVVCVTVQLVVLVQLPIVTDRQMDMRWQPIAR